jgi:PIN domain nuclease of toxin-antitoxin system
MNLLLDTHVLLWWLDDHPSLGEEARREISNGNNLTFISAVVIWEIRIKESLGKLEIPSGFRRTIENQGFEMLAITTDHAHAVANLPAYHRDPFDGMLIAQARLEGFTVVTRDKIFDKYGIPIIKA